MEECAIKNLTGLTTTISETHNKTGKPNEQMVSALMS